MANPGQEGGSIKDEKGAGYSGGGQAQGIGHSGGSDGSDGDGTYGGSGTQEEISDYIFITWTLTPGDGGSAHYSTYYTGNGGSWNGGGGGGVLVNSKGPGTDTEYNGQGYGGGGSGASPNRIGLPGLVLLEISSG